MPPKLLVIQIAGLGHSFANANGIRLAKHKFAPMETVFPALTCPVQASFRTGLPPLQHGMLMNGIYHADLRRPLFWEQSSNLVKGERIWDEWRKRGKKIAVMFWQQIMGENADLIISPAPIHKHHGSMIDDCYAKPVGLYRHLCEKVKRRFKLIRYWGPLATPAASAWIAEATAALLEDKEYAPDLCLTYLPALDYDLQRYGPMHPRSISAARQLQMQLEHLVSRALNAGYEIAAFGDYAIGEITASVFPNKFLLDAGLMSVREVRRQLYPDFHESHAFAVCDHEVARVYARNEDEKERAKGVLLKSGEIEVLSDSSLNAEASKKECNTSFYIQAVKGKWLAYPWWNKWIEAPDYARHVDIHNKPGYDPCELFFGWPPGSVTLDTSRIGGSHGRIGNDRMACMATTLPVETSTLQELSHNIKNWMNSNG